MAPASLVCSLLHSFFLKIWCGLWEKRHHLLLHIWMLYLARQSPMSSSKMLVPVILNQECCNQCWEWCLDRDPWQWLGMILPKEVWYKIHLLIQCNTRRMQITKVDVNLSACIDLGLLGVLWLGRPATLARSILNFTTFLCQFIIKKTPKTPNQINQQNQPKHTPRTPRWLFKMLFHYKITFFVRLYLSPIFVQSLSFICQ